MLTTRNETGRWLRLCWFWAAFVGISGLLFACTFASNASDHGEEHTGSTQQAATIGAPGSGQPGGVCGYVERLANGDVQLAIKFPVAQADVQVFAKQNGVQNVAQAMLGFHNADGTFTYRVIIPASKYKAGDKIAARFYSAVAGQPGVFSPGPTDATWLPDLAYGSASCAEDYACSGPEAQRSNITKLSNGDVKFNVLLPGKQKYVEVFVQQNGTQIVAQNIVGSGAPAENGQYGYSLVLPASRFKTGDRILARFYSYLVSAPGIFTPGPTEPFWLPPFVYGAPAPTGPCPAGGATWNEPKPYGALPSDTDAIVPSAASGTTAPGRVGGIPNVDSTGAFLYRLPLEVPPGRAGMSPDLALSYNSNGGNGLLGVGWSLDGLSAIGRCPKTVAREGIADSVKVKRPADYCPFGNCPTQSQQYAPDIDNFCLDGEKLVHVGGTDLAPEFRTERDSQSRIVATYAGAFWPASFTVWRRDGRIATYVQPPAVSAPEGYDIATGAPSATTFSGVLAWPISTLRDRFGNQISYDYVSATENGEATAARLPNSIDYTTCAAGSACTYGGATRRIKFSYETRPDYLTRWVGGLKASVGVRLSTIQELTLQGGGERRVRSYLLGYDTSAATSRSRLTTVKECDAAGVCTQPTVFDWGSKQGQNFRRTWHVLGPAETAGYTVPGQCDASLAPDCFFADFTTIPDMLGYALAGDGPIETRMSVADFDGNGTDDIVTLQPSGQHRIYLSKLVNGQVTFPAADSQDVGVFGDLNTIALDIDQDGESELLQRKGPATGQWSVMHYDPRFRFQIVSLDGIEPLIFTTEYKNSPNPPFFMDVNGDGILDELWDSNPPDDTGYDRSAKWMRSLAEPLGNALIPHEYLPPVHQFWSPAPGEEEMFRAGVCRLAPMDYAGHGRKSPVGVCDDTTAAALGERPNPGDQDTVFVDLNGDGLTDTLRFFNKGSVGSVVERISTGMELQGAETGPLPGNTERLQQTAPVDIDETKGFASPGGSPYRNAVVDFNSDGIADIVRGGTSVSFPGNKAPLQLWIGSNVPGRTTIRKTLLPQSSRGRLGRPQVGDFNGDGLPDLVQATEGGKLQFLIQDTSNRDDVLTSVTSDSASLAAITYKSGPREALGPVTPEQPGVRDRTGGLSTSEVFEPRRGLNVVSELNVLEGKGRGLYYYQYSEAATDVSGRGFLGFGKVIRADVLRSTLTMTTYRNRVYEGDLHGYHIFPFAFLPATVETVTGIDPVVVAGMNVVPPLSPQASSLEKRTELRTELYRTRKLFAPGGTLSDSSTYFVENYDTKTSRKDKDGVAYYAGAVTRTYDDFANITDLDSTDGPAKALIHNVVNNDTGPNWFIGQVQSSQTTQTRTDFTGPADTQTTLPQTVSYTYGSNGEARSVTNQPGEAWTRTVTRYEPDAVGLIRTITTTDTFGGQRAQSIEYSSDGVYAEHLQDTLGHDTWVGYHSGLGVPLIAFDANNNKTLYKYDGFGNPRTIAPTSAPVTSITYAQTNGALQVTRVQSPGTRSVQSYDQRGQLSRSVVSINGEDATTHYGYDQLGRLLFESVPYRGTTAPGSTIYAYDNLNTVRFVLKPDGSTVKQDWAHALILQTIASGDGTAANPDRGTLVSRTPDGLVLSVREISNTGAVNSRGVDFVYGQGRGLVQVKELGGPTTTYYSFGLPKPSRVVDSERGETQFAYDGFFNPRTVTHVAPSPQQRSSEAFEYDSIGRLTHLAATGPDPANPANQVTRDTRFGYDLGQGAIGSISSSSSPDGVSIDYGYTPEGLLSMKKYVSGGDAFRIDYQYDAYGRVSRIDYPETGSPRVSVGLGYNDTGSTADGLLRSVSRGSTTYWQATARGPDGLTQQATLAGGLTQQLGIELSTRRITDIVVGSSTQTVFNVHNDYFVGGNLKQRTDRVTGVVEQFGYDSFNQLKSWNLSGGGLASVTEAYDYDALGNQKSSGTVARTFGGTGFSPHQLASQTKGAETRTFSYDYRGRRTGMKINGTTARTVAFTSFDLPSTVTTTQPAQTINYRYDANNRKFSETGGATNTTYIDDIYERRVDRATNTTKHVFAVYAEGQRVAQVVQSGSTETTSVLHSDVLSSVNGSTRVTGGISAKRQAFNPWGERIVANTSTLQTRIDDVTAGFTGHEHDESVGLINMRGRVYDPVTHTFLSPEPVVNGVYQIAGWNKYGYARNNPTAFVDPSGFMTITAGVESATGEDGFNQGSSSFRTESTYSSSAESYSQKGMSSPAPGISPSPGPSFDAGAADLTNSTPGGAAPLSPEAYKVTIHGHGPGTDNPFGLLPDVVITPNWSVPTPAPTPIEQLLAGGPAGNNNGGVLQRPKPMPVFGDVYTAFFDKNASEEAKDGARAEIVANIAMILMGSPELVEAKEAAVLAEEAVTLYRAVGPSELASIRTLGRYAVEAGGTEGKYFFKSAEQASNFARMMGDQAYTTTSVSVSASELSFGQAINPAREGPGYFFSSGHLPSGNVKVFNFSALP